MNAKNQKRKKNLVIAELPLHSSFKTNKKLKQDADTFLVGSLIGLLMTDVMWLAGYELLN